MNASMIIDQQVDALKAHLDNWRRELKAKLEIPQQGHSIGISYEPGVTLDRMPGEAVIGKGLYRPRGYKTVQDNLVERVEVVQPSKDGLVIFRTFYSPEGDDLATMSVAHFDRLYEPIGPHDFPGRPRSTSSE
jgi:hypothetical protein